jgi:hypothetical protein
MSKGLCEVYETAKYVEDMFSKRDERINKFELGI